MPPTGVYTGANDARADVHRARIIYNSAVHRLRTRTTATHVPHSSIDELLRYSAEERDTWRRWLVANPAAIDAPMQPGGRFPTVGKLIDHIFLVERRHLQRLQRPAAVARHRAHRQQRARRSSTTARRYGARWSSSSDALDEHEADEVRTIEVRDRQWPVTPRKLLFHILVHEIRHWAQIALAVRLAGFEPPGDHDLFFSHALK